MPAQTSSKTPFPELLRGARLRLLQMHFEAGVGHIGGNLSSLDIMMFLHHNVMSGDDMFILSKGHSAGALYVTLWSLGKLKDEDLKRFHKDATKLAGHPPPSGIEGIPFATGSLGHGLSLAAGVALGRRLAGKPGRVFCLLSDGEWNEGSNWEALIFAAHHKLDNLTLIVDANGLQGFGTTKEVADLGSLEQKLRAFHAATEEIDGHDMAALARALASPAPGPRAIVARTKKGHGVSFMEDKMEWHYKPMTPEEYKKAVAEISRR